MFSKMIFEEQFGFPFNWQIYNAMDATHQGLHTIKLNNFLAINMNIDSTKAYDKVNWLYKYVARILIEIGFKEGLQESLDIGVGQMLYT